MAKKLLSHQELGYVLSYNGVTVSNQDPNRPFIIGGTTLVPDAKKLISRNTVIWFSSSNKPQGTDYIDFGNNRVRFTNPSNNRILVGDNISIESLAPTPYIKFRNGDYDYNIYQLFQFDGTSGTMIGGRYKNDITEVLLGDGSYSSQSGSLLRMFEGMDSLEVFRTTGVNNYTTSLNTTDGFSLPYLKIIDFRAFKALTMLGGSGSYPNLLSLTEVHIGAVNPPILGPDSFYNSPAVKFYVPNGRAQVYKNNNFWSGHASKIYNSPEF